MPFEISGTLQQNGITWKSSTRRVWNHFLADMLSVRKGGIQITLAHVNKALFLLAVIETRRFQQEFGVMPNFQARYSKCIFSKQAQHNVRGSKAIFDPNQGRPKWACANGLNVREVSWQSASPFLWWFEYGSWGVMQSLFQSPGHRKIPPISSP